MFGEGVPRHFKIDVEQRIAATFDRNFVEIFGEISPVDFLGFKDTKGYKQRLDEAKQAAGRNDAVVCIKGGINGLRVLSALFDFNFLGGSLGSVVGEKITLLLEKGAEEKTPVIVFCTSGGARMQEGILSLMQMSKITGAIRKINDAKVPFITVLIDPTLGGVSASLASLGDYIMVEPKAMIGFAGARVIEETIKRKLPEGFQRSEFLYEHGMVDKVVHRKEVKDALYSYLMLFV